MLQNELGCDINNTHYMSRKVTRALITAAGIGTRFLPATKNLPKEMLPIVDTPIIHYIAEECVEAGIEDIIIVIRPGNEAIMNYFTRSKQLEKYLQENGKERQLERYHKLVNNANFIFVHQRPDLPYGNGSPILTAKNLLKNGPFVLCWGDDMVLYHHESPVKQVIDTYVNNEDSYGVLGVTEVPKEEVTRYGIVETEGGKSEGRIVKLIEKPKIEEVTSNLAEFGRMVLAPEIFEYLTPTNTGKDGELWLIDSIAQLMKDKPVYAKLIDGEFLTTGDPLRFLKASFKFALERPDLREDLLTFFREEVLKQ